MQKRIVVFPLIIAALITGGCSPSQSAQVYSADDARKAMESREAVVIATRPAIVQAKEDQIGGLSGGALGGTLGYAAGGGMFRPVLMVGGAIIGLTVGPWFERQLKRRDAVEVEIRYDDGEHAVIVQEDDIELKNGDPVQVIRDGSGRLHVRAAHRVSAR